MKYTDEQLKARLLAALENSAYYSDLWGNEGGKEAREDKGYYNGQADLMIELYGELITDEEASIAYQAGEDRYANENEG
jgi:hypothetical protein